MTEAANDHAHESTSADATPEEMTTPDGRVVILLRERPIRVTASGRVSEEDAARYLGSSVRTLQRMRQQRRGPKYEMGSRVMYTLADLDEYLADCKVDPLAS